MACFGATAHFFRGLKMTIRRRNIITYRVDLYGMLQPAIPFHRCSRQKLSLNEPMRSSLMRMPCFSNQ